MDLEIIGAVYNVLPNGYLAGVEQKNLERGGRREVHAGGAGRSRRTLRKTLPAASGRSRRSAPRRRSRRPDRAVRRQRLDRRRRRELERARPSGSRPRHWVPGHAGPQLAGRRGRRDVHRRQGDDGGRQDDGADRGRICSRTRTTSRRRARSARSAAANFVYKPRLRRSEAAARLSEGLTGEPGPAQGFGLMALGRRQRLEP